MLPTDLIKWFCTLFVVWPIVAAVAAFRGPPALQASARWLLLAAWLANAAAAVACLKQSVATPSSGIGNGVFLLVAIPFALLAVLWWGVWRAACRHAYLQTLPPDLRRVEELEDIERSLESARKSVARAEGRVKSWLISGEERDRLRSEIDGLQSLIANLEQERAKRIGGRGTLARLSG